MMKRVLAVALVLVLGIGLLAIGASAAETSFAFTLACPYFPIFVDVPAGVLPEGTAMEVWELSVSREPEEQHLPHGWLTVVFFYQGEQVQPNGKLTFRLLFPASSPVWVWTSDVTAYGPLYAEDGFVVFESYHTTFTTMNRSPSCPVPPPPVYPSWLQRNWVSVLGVVGIAVLSVVNVVAVFFMARTLFAV
ncbi:MAG: hypothetical protein FWB76_05740 [Oscillospiraceae bacterium]|nr:hypothetical protein [Oscillospiraceae bacterium]